MWRGLKQPRQNEGVVENTVLPAAIIARRSFPSQDAVKSKGLLKGEAVRHMLQMGLDWLFGWNWKSSTCPVPTARKVELAGHRATSRGNWSLLYLVLQE